MSLAWGNENLPNIVVASTTQVTFAATNNGSPTTVIVGGQRYPLTTGLSVSTGSTGAGGLDTGVIAAIQLYYVYVIVNSSTFTPALIASTNVPSTGPTVPGGYYTAWRLVGAFYTDIHSNVGSMVPIQGPAVTTWMALNSANSNGSTGQTVYATGSTNGQLWTNTTIEPHEWRRNGTFLEVRGAILFSAAPGVGTGGFSVFFQNTGFIFDTTDTTGNTFFGYPAGQGVLANGSGSNNILHMHLTTFGGSGVLGLAFDCGANLTPFQMQPAASIPRAFVANDYLEYYFSCPVTVWTGKPTLL